VILYGESLSKIRGRFEAERQAGLNPAFSISCVSAGWVDLLIFPRGCPPAWTRCQRRRSERQSSDTCQWSAASLRHQLVRLFSRKGRGLNPGRRGFSFFCFRQGGAAGMRADPVIPLSRRAAPSAVRPGPPSSPGCRSSFSSPGRTW